MPIDPDQSADDLRRRIFLEGRQQPVRGDEIINAIEDTNVMLGDQPVDPENLAYILIGVCVGLSILCLIVVAVTIGYKSETHYRLENNGGHRRRIRLIKASSSEGSTSSEAGTEEDNEENGGKGGGEVDLSTMKLGSWFTSKHPVQTLDRKKAKMVYPSAVYLDNLESSKNAETPVKVTNRSEVVTDEENFEDDLNHKRTTSRLKITKKVALNDAQSVSSMDTIKSEDARLEQPRRSSESTVASETAALTAKAASKNNTKSKVCSYTKKIDKKASGNSSSAAVRNESAAVTSATVLHNPRANTAASGSKHKYLSHRSSKAASSDGTASAMASKHPHDNQSQISSSREGSFRFLQHEEIEHTPTPKRPHNEAEDSNSIQWSTNSDRLI